MPSSDPILPPGDAPLVVVTVGTEDYPFERLVRWVDSWLERATRPVRCFMQHGTAAPPRLADGRPFLPFDDLLEAIREASVVVSHGGPATIALVHEAGMKPIVVPRVRSQGEHVDDHQVAFARRIAAQGAIELAETRDALWRSLDATLADGSHLETRPLRSSDEAVRRFSELVDALLAERQRS